MTRFSALKPFAPALLLSFLFLAAGCGDEEVVEVVQEPAIQVSVSVSAENVDAGGKVTVIAAAEAENPGVLAYSWKSTAGTFSSAANDTTVWIAPDEPNLYTLSCVVTDGADVGIGSDRVMVGAYVPSVEPYYIGAATCAECHAGGGGGDQYTTWSATAHATAVETLRGIGMGTNAYCLGCHTVGTYGLGVDPEVDVDNGGYDETSVARLEGVQCENCHGAASEHVDGTEDEGKAHAALSVAVSLTDTLCGQCHTDEHHPTWDEWQESPHASVVTSAATRGSCAKCHNGLVAYQYLDAPNGFPTPANPTETVAHTCAVCHDPHGNDNPGQLRNASVTDIALPNSPLIPNAGAGRLCMSCHNGRRTETDVESQIEDGTAHLGPHHSVQGDMLAGVNAYEDVDTNFTFTSSKHILVQDACITCHVARQEEELPYFTGHTFEPTTHACQPCHGAISEFTDIVAKEDFDGDGAIEGVQDEVRGLLDSLRVAIIDASVTEEAREAIEEAEDFTEVVGDTLVSTRDQRAASYNWAFVEFDGSHGVHNAAYSVQVLQRSILFLDSGKLAKAHLLVE